jgi:hypothetical protein
VPATPRATAKVRRTPLYVLAAIVVSALVAVVILVIVSKHRGEPVVSTEPVKEPPPIEPVKRADPPADEPAKHVEPTQPDRPSPEDPATTDRAKSPRTEPAEARRETKRPAGPPLDPPPKPADKLAVVHTDEKEVPAPPGIKTEGSVHFIQTAQTSITKPADYNPRRFDPIAYLPNARSLARLLLDDAELTAFEFDPVYPDGHVDVTAGRDHEYDFRSPKKSVRPAGTPKNVALDQECRVHVEVGPSSVVASLRKSETCTERIVRVPRCTFAQLWAKVRAGRIAGDDIVVRIGWLFDEKWLFDTDPDALGKGGGVNSLEDRCP